MSPALVLAAAAAWASAAPLDCSTATACSATGIRPAPLSVVPGVRGFSSRPRCPRGTRAVMTPEGLQPYRCAREDAAAPAAAPSGKSRRADKGELAFDYPEGWRLTDAWSDAPPTLYLALDQPGAGKPVTVVVTRYDAGQAGYQPLEEAFAAERKWRGAKDAGVGSVAGRAARLAAVAGESRTAYVPAGKGRYYTFIYSAPPEAYAAHEPAFSSLLASLKLGDQ